MKKLLRDNGLTLVLLGLFCLFWSLQAFCGWQVFNDEETLHGMPAVPFTSYLSSGHFWQATGENWESEFLQMGAYVVLTAFLFQRGSAESKDPDAPQGDHPPEDAVRFGFIRRNSLSLVLLLFFVAAFMVHAVGGLVEENAKREDNGQPPETLTDFLSGSEFWFQSFQNWQSEFLAVLSIVVLTIFLRQHGSPESKAVSDPNSKTGA